MEPFTTAILFLALLNRSDARAEALVLQLGSESFSVRQKAYGALRELGFSAVPVLELNARMAADLEVADRCDKLLREFYRFEAGEFLEKNIMAGANERYIKSLLRTGMPRAAVHMIVQGMRERAEAENVNRTAVEPYEEVPK